MKEGSRRGAEWLAQRQRPNGCFSPTVEWIESSYKGLWALHASGLTGEAVTLADRIESLVRPNGDLPEPRTEEYFLDVHYLYPHGYLTIGAQLLGRFELARKLMSYTKTLQNPVHGGFRSHGDDRNGDQHCDTVSTGIAGLAALYTNELGVARAAGQFMHDLWRSQPDPKTVFYPTISADGTISTSADAMSVRVTEPDQDWYFIGLPALFLTSLYEATGEDKHLALAEEVLTFLDESCHEDAFLDPSFGKGGVAAAMLYRLTGKSRYRELAVHVGGLLLARQHPDGKWAEAAPEDVQEIDWPELDMTFEYTLWLDLIHRNVRSGDQTGGIA